jgi:hypothetical protein
MNIRFYSTIIIGSLLFISNGFAQTNVFPADGNVGIGTDSPVYKLEVIGRSAFTGQAIFDTLKSGFVNANSFSTNTSGFVRTATLYTQVIDGTLSSNPSGNAQLAVVADDFNVRNPGYQGRIQLYQGSFLVGGASFESDIKMNVRGLTQLDGLRLQNNNARNGYILTCDDMGNATWRPSSLGAAGNFSLNGNEVTLDDPYDLRVRNKLKIGISSLVLSGTTIPGTTNDIYADGNGDLLIQSDVSNTSSNTFLNAKGGRVIIGSSFIGPPFLNNKLYVNGNIAWANFSTLSADQGGSIELGGNNNIAGAGASYLDFHYLGKTEDYNTRIVNDVDGAMRIYALNGLTLDGKGLLCKEICVKNNLIWCDYVFEKDYKLLSLYEVERYIKQNKHLPEIPSAREVEENGVNMSEMVTLQMKKIEELTLYTISLQKQLDEMKKEIEKMKK